MTPAVDKQQTVAVIDYGMGNLHSVKSALEYVAPEQNVIVTSDPAVVAAADRVVFPGVGAIRDCMTEIKRLGFAPARASRHRQTGSGHLRWHAGIDGPQRGKQGCGLH
jgi:imidazoleglycerol phosphate synthase glutamine amidotransferase subunit HisH